MTSNVFAQPTAPTTPAAVDQQEGPNEVQTADNSADNQKDGETADDTTVQLKDQMETVTANKKTVLNQESSIFPPLFSKSIKFLVGFSTYK